MVNKLNKIELLSGLIHELENLSGCIFEGNLREFGYELIYKKHSIWIECSGIATYGGPARVTYRLSDEKSPPTSLWQKLSRTLFPTKKKRGWEFVDLEFPTSRLPICSLGQLKELAEIVSRHESLGGLKKDPDLKKVIKAKELDMNESDLVYDVITSASHHHNPIVPWLDRCGRSYDAEGFSEYFDIWDETVGDTECLLEDWEEEAAHLRKLGRSGEIKPYLPPQRGSQRYTACHRYSFNVSPDKCDLWLVEHPHTYSLSGGEYDVFPELSQVEAKPVSIKFMVENVSGKSSHQLSMKELKAICEKVTQVLGIDGSSESEDGS